MYNHLVDQVQHPGHGDGHGDLRTLTLDDSKPRHRKHIPYDIRASANSRCNYNSDLSTRSTLRQSITDHVTSSIDTYHPLFTPFDVFSLSRVSRASILAYSMFPSWQSKGTAYKKRNVAVCNELSRKLGAGVELCGCEARLLWLKEEGGWICRGECG